LDLWLALMLGMVVYAGWDITLRAAVALAAPYVSGSPSQRVALPIGFALVVVAFGLALVAGFDSLVLVGSVVGRPAGGAPGPLASWPHALLSWWSATPIPRAA